MGGGGERQGGPPVSVWVWGGDPGDGTALPGGDPRVHPGAPVRWRREAHVRCEGMGGGGTPGGSTGASVGAGSGSASQRGTSGEGIPAYIRAHHFR